MKQRYSRSNQSGFTLIELLIVMIIMGILSLSLANFIVTWLQASSLAQNRSTLLYTAENALDIMTQDIELSGYADLNNQYPDPYAPGGQYGWTSGPQVLVLAKVAVDKYNNVIYSDSAKYITLKDNEIYFLSGTTMYRRTLSSGNSSDVAVTTCPAADATPSCPADKVIATNVSSLNFSYYDANENIVAPDDARSIQASITVYQKSGVKTITASYATRMVFRNE
ncbi:MAG TPA: type II secretion system protein [Candidatus Saccharimonadales bacterium]|nr:type II secretion system protein [Candidatus Saccharimonadales bacterium]